MHLLLPSLGRLSLTGVRPGKDRADPNSGSETEWEDEADGGGGDMSIAGNVETPGMSKRQLAKQNVRDKAWWKDFFAESDREEAKQKEQPKKEDELEWWTKELDKSLEEVHRDWIDNEEESSEEPGEAPPLTERSKMTKSQRLAHDRIKRDVITKWVKKHDGESKSLDHNDAEIVELLEMGFTRDQVMRYINKLRLAAAARAQE